MTRELISTFDRTLEDSTMMRLATDDTDVMTLPVPEPVDAVDTDEWPAEVDIILSAMDVGLHSGPERRATRRQAQRCRADLRLYAHDAGQPPIPLFTRDVSATGVGFITRDRLPLGYTGLVRIILDSGDSVTAACRVYRCREAIGGWYEGALHFTARQPDLG